MRPLEAYLAYKAKGWAIMPLRPENEKRPHIADWPNYTATEVDFPDGVNVGIITGQRSGLLVLDVDGPLGRAEIAKLPMPATRCIGTPSGGMHYYFAHREGFKNAVRLRPGLDIRTDRGYVMAPPSPGYRVLADHPVVEMPDDLFKALLGDTGVLGGPEGKRKPAFAPDDLTPEDWLSGRRQWPDRPLPVSVAGEGGQTAIVRIIRTLIRDFYVFDVETVWRLIRDVYNPRHMTGRNGLDPWSASEVAKKFGDVWAVALAEMPFPARAVPKPEDPKALAAWEKSQKWIIAPVDITNIVQKDPHLSEFSFDVRSRAIRGPDPELDWRVQLATYLDRRAGIKNANRYVSRNTVEGQSWPQYFAKYRPRDPVVAMLNGLQWDGRPRVEYWLDKLFGLELHPIEREGWLKWSRSAVLRAFEPGFPIEGSLVLVDEKGGAGKGLFFRHFFGYGTDMVVSQNVNEGTHKLDHPDVLTKLNRCWLFVLDELAGAYKFAQIEELKAFMTASEDTWRPYWQPDRISAPRRSVIAGATNESKIINDDAMSRRMFIVNVSRPEIHITEFLVKSERDQVWAELVHWYRTTPKSQWHAGVHFGNRVDELRAHNAQYMYVPEERLDLEDFLDGKTGFIPNAIVKVHCPHQGIRTKTMRALGWKSTLKYENEKRIRGWEKPA